MAFLCLVLLCIAAVGKYAICADSPYPLGGPAISRNKTDRLAWSFVSREGVCEPGHVRQIRLFSGRANQTLHVGVFRPSGPACRFRLVRQLTWTGGFDLGLNVVNLTDDEALGMMTGDHYGLSWPDKGTVTYDNIAEKKYCEGAGLVAAGDIASLSDVEGTREYAIELIFHPMGLDNDEVKGSTHQKFFHLRALSSAPPQTSDLLPGPAPAPTSPHATSCAWRCQLTAACVSFRWHGATGACQLLASSYRHNETSDGLEQDWKLYACPINMRSL